MRKKKRRKGKELGLHARKRVKHLGRVGGGVDSGFAGPAAQKGNQGGGKKKIHKRNAP